MGGIKTSIKTHVKRLERIGMMKVSSDFFMQNSVKFSGQ